MSIIQVAAVALMLGSCTLVTKDSDFAGIPGRSIEDWS
jgi:predicted nucleic acid-binding protein